MSCRSILAVQSYLAVPVYVPPEEVNVGRALFHDFVHEQFQQQGLNDEAVIDNSNADIVREHVAMVQNLVSNRGDGIVEGVENFMYRNVGTNIRNIANDFAHSVQRDMVRQHAYEVDLGILTRDGFWALLEEVFRDGVNVYNIIALFFFCSDILIRSVKVELTRVGINLFKWALQYISEQVCSWVYKHGGWEKAVKKIMRNVVGKKYIAYGASVVICVAVGWGLYKAIKS